MHMELPRYVEVALNALHENGYEAYLVGGCVRDFVLGRPVNDHDITTSALPEQIKDVFCGYTIADVGIKHGSILVVIDGEPLEITTYRYESEYRDHRHPDQVYFTRELKEDLKRRDFTMNALVYAPSTGVLDHFDGITDIQSKIIRAIGDPAERFDEDALRILRALRFSSQLGFTIEDDTLKGMDSKKHLLEYISKERITQEIMKWINGEYPLVTKKTADIILPVVFPNYPPESQEMLEEMAKHSDPLLRTTILDQYLQGDLKHNLLLPKKMIRSMEVLAKYFVLPADMYETRCMVGHLESELLDILLEYYAIQYPDEYLNIRHQIEVSRGLCCKVDQLSINGKDLVELGLQGACIKDMLNQVLEEAMHDSLSNTRDEILTYIKQYITKDM